MSGGLVVVPPESSARFREGSGNTEPAGCDALEELELVVVVVVELDELGGRANAKKSLLFAWAGAGVLEAAAAREPVSRSIELLGVAL